jgi:type III restriction enzyme
VIDPFPFQYAAADLITTRFVDYLSRRPGKVLGPKLTFTPYYQALASITASGKTVIMAQTISQMLPILTVRPLVIWLSKGRVVVDQTLANLDGKYRHLLAGFEGVRLLADYDAGEVLDPHLALIFLATVGTFNQRSKDKGSLRLFQSDIDNATRSTWDALKQRLTVDGTRRPLIIVYDEAHNLSDQQTDLLMELDPDAFLLATATPKLPQAILRVIADLKESLQWTDADLTTYVSSRDVVEAGLVKREVRLGGYQAQMDETIRDLLTDMAACERAALGLGVAISPKAIYVCRTNIVEGNAYKSDDPHRPFNRREAPPILIWRYLVNEKGVPPESIAVYTSALKFDKEYPPPDGFIQFKGGDSDYATFASGEYRHIIFNLGLQEGWDDPEVYFAYVDKSMQSNIQVEQVIGRVLRQPGVTHFEAAELNTANFYIRVDTRTVFVDVVREVSQRLSGDLPDIQISVYDGKKRKRPKLIPPRENRTVPHVWRDPKNARQPIQDLIDNNLMNFVGASGENVHGGGAKALVQQMVGEGSHAELQWVEKEHGSVVSARWVFQTAVRRQYPLALEVTASDDPKFDALIELGSPADIHIRAIADDVVRTYLEHVILRQNIHNPYVVGDVLVDPSQAEEFEHSLHGGYSGLNKTLELPFARELDRQKLTWCRNPSRSGYSIPLVSLGASKNFYPDFLAWRGRNVFALDTKGDHILQADLGRKLLAVSPHPKAKDTLIVRLISTGAWDKTPQRVSGGGFTVWALAPGNSLRPIRAATLAEAVKLALKAEI